MNAPFVGLAVRVVPKFGRRPWLLRLWEWIRDPRGTPLSRFARRARLRMTVRGMAILNIPLDVADVRDGYLVVHLAPNLPPGWGLVLAPNDPFELSVSVHPPMRLAAMPDLLLYLDGYVPDPKSDGALESRTTPEAT